MQYRVVNEPPHIFNSLQDLWTGRTLASHEHSSKAFKPSVITEGALDSKSEVVQDSGKTFQEGHQSQTSSSVKSIMMMRTSCGALLIYVLAHVVSILNLLWKVTVQFNMQETFLEALHNLKRFITRSPGGNPRGG